MITELRTLIAISRYGTFSAAGGKVGLTQAAVSGQMKRLEDSIGFPLFDRTRRSAVLNADGARVLARAKAIVALVDALGDPEVDAISGTLKLGAIASLQSSLLARAVARFRDRFLGMKVQIVPGLSINLVDRVDNGDLDLAIMIRPPFALPEELVWQRLAVEPYALAVPSTVSSEDWREILRTEPLMRYDQLSLGGREVDRFVRELPFPVAHSMEVPVQSMLPMVQNGLGVALIPLAEAHLPLPVGVRAIQLRGAKLEREIGILRLNDSAAASPVRHMADCLMALYLGSSAP
jgi:DNA-binding transcriptional LysR family regulator